MIAAGDFLEHADVYGNYYGTSPALDRVASSRATTTCCSRSTGRARARCASSFRTWSGSSSCRPRSPELRSRLEGRGKDSPEVIERRMASAREEISHVLEFEYIIVNERFEAAFADLMAVVRATRVSRAQQSIRLAKLIDEFK